MKLETAHDVAAERDDAERPDSPSSSPLGLAVSEKGVGDVVEVSTP